MWERKSEVGSEYWDVPVCDVSRATPFSAAQWYLSGRSALRAIIGELGGIRSVAMPTWCCDSMVKPFADAGIKVRFYPVYPGDGLVQEVDTGADALLLMDYFGYTGGLTAQHPCVIRDVTHSIFSRSYDDAAYCFGSLRKWCGLWTGGYVWTGDGHKLPVEQGHDNGYALLRERAMQLKSYYINGRLDADGRPVEDKSYLHLFEEAEELLENAGALPAAARDVELAHRLDVGFIQTRRRENAAILMEAFPEQLVFPRLGEEDCPLFVPILVPGGKRDALRRYLIENDIFCPVHWPVSRYHRLDARERVLYDSGLSLVCDQRYNRNDMYRLVETVKRFWKEER